MTDYGRPLEFGWFPEPLAASSDQLLALAQYADRAGLDLLGIQDHPYQRRFLDTLTLIPWLAGQTQRVRFFPDVANLPLRHPAMLAKAAASVDVLSGGRFELGLGAGAFWEAIEAMGVPRRTPAEAVEATEEAITILRQWWSGERSVRMQGRHYRVSGAKPGPPPAHEIGIWLGVGGPRMLALCGRLADGWVPSSSWASPERLPELHGRIDEAATAAGREPSAIRRAYNISGRITASDSAGFLDGPVDQWVDELTTLVVEQGMDTFLLWVQGDVETQLRRFAEEVVPATRAAVAGARGAT